MKIKSSRCDFFGIGILEKIGCGKIYFLTQPIFYYYRRTIVTIKAI